MLHNLKICTHINTLCIYIHNDHLSLLFVPEMHRLILFETICLRFTFIKHIISYYKMKFSVWIKISERMMFENAKS